MAKKSTPKVKTAKKPASKKATAKRTIKKAVSKVKKKTVKQTASKKAISKVKKRKSPKALTHKQQLFINHYLANGGNGTQAAKSAGYKGSYKTLNQVAMDNLEKPIIKKELDKERNRLKKITNATTENKRKMLWEAANRSMNDPIFNEEGKNTGISKFDNSGVVRAINELNKMDGDHAAVKNELTGKDGAPLTPVLNVTISDS